MSKYDFLLDVREHLQIRVGDGDMHVESSVCVVNNDTERLGVTIRKGKQRVSPIFYLDRFYDDYVRKKITVDETVDKILFLLNSVEHERAAHEDISVDFDDCRGRIVYRLLSKEKNRRYTQNMPNLPFLNLCIIFLIVTRVENDNIEVIRVTDEIMKSWGVTENDLLKLARVNTPEFFPARIDSMIDVMESIAGENMPDGFDKNDMPMYVLTNRQSIFGATTILYENVIESIAEAFDSGFYIIPSSVHEVILLPERGVEDRDELNKMVREVNENCVAKEEVLSDNAYYYSITEKRFYF